MGRKSTIGEYIEQCKRELEEKGYTVIRFNVANMLDYMTNKVVKWLEDNNYDYVVKENDRRSRYIRIRRGRK